MLQVEYLQVHNEENHSCVQCSSYENGYKATEKICIYYNISIKFGFETQNDF